MTVSLHRLQNTVEGRFGLFRYTANHLRDGEISRTLECDSVFVIVRLEQFFHYVLL